MRVINLLKKKSVILQSLIPFYAWKLRMSSTFRRLGAPRRSSPSRVDVLLELLPQPLHGNDLGLPGRAGSHIGGHVVPLALDVLILAVDGVVVHAAAVKVGVGGGGDRVGLARTPNLNRKK